MEACGAYGEVCDQLVVDRVGVAAEAGLAVIATGGWGRRELCPYSDLDILFLAEEMPRSIPDSAADESAESGDWPSHFRGLLVSALGCGS